MERIDTAVMHLKPLATLILTDDCAWIEQSLDAGIAGAHRTTDAVWKLGKALVANAVRQNPEFNSALELPSTISCVKHPSLRPKMWYY